MNFSDVCKIFRLSQLEKWEGYGEGCADEMEKCRDIYAAHVVTRIITGSCKRIKDFYGNCKLLEIILLLIRKVFGMKFRFC